MRLIKTSQLCVLKSRGGDRGKFLTRYEFRSVNIDFLAAGDTSPDLGAETPTDGAEWQQI